MLNSENHKIKRTFLYDIIPKDFLKMLVVLYGAEKTPIGYLKEHVKITALNKKKLDAEENLKKGIFSLENCNADKPSTLVYNINPKDLIKELKEIEYDEVFDYYISKNTFKTEITSTNKITQIEETGRSSGLYSVGKNYKSDRTKKGGFKKFVITRTENNLMGLKNIVIDIDCHDVNDPNEMEILKEYFVNSAIFEGLPTPTAVVFTGRGFHIYYSIFEVSMQLKEIYRTIARNIAEKFKLAIKNVGLDEFGFSTDVSASVNISGLIRLEGTPNTESDVPAQIIEFSQKKYNINELKDAFNIIIPKKKTTKPKKKWIPYKLYNKLSENFKSDSNDSNSNVPDAELRRKSGVFAMLSQRLNVIKQCVNNNQRNHGAGIRDKYCFAYYNIATQLYEPETAINKVMDFNFSSFDQPLDKAEVYNLINGVNNSTNKYYKYTNTAFADLLELTDKEIYAFGLYPFASKDKDYETKREIEADEKRAAKQQRNVRIKNVFMATGSIKTTAENIGVCENTVRNVLKKIGCKNKIISIKKKTKYARDRKIFNSFIKYRDINKAAKAGNCSRNTAVKVIKKYAKLNRQIENAFNQNPRLKKVDDLIFFRKASFHNIFRRSDYYLLEKLISEELALPPEAINIAIAPYLIRHERDLSQLAQVG